MARVARFRALDLKDAFLESKCVLMRTSYVAVLANVKHEEGLSPGWIVSSGYTIRYTRLDRLPGQLYRMIYQIISNGTILAA